MTVVCAASALQYLYKVIRQLLPLAYSLLGRTLFGDILETHLSCRSRDNLDQLVPV